MFHRRPSRVVVALPLLWLTACGALPLELQVSQPSSQSDGTAESLPRRYIVSFRSDAGGKGLGFSTYRREFLFHHQWLSRRYLSDPRLKDIHFVTALDHRVASRPKSLSHLKLPPILSLPLAEKTSSVALGAIADVEFRDEASAQELLAEWRRRGDIWFAEPNYLSRLTQDGDKCAGEIFCTYATAYESAASSYTPIEAIQLWQAFNSIATDPQGAPNNEEVLADPAIVAVMDSGIDYSHSAVKDRLWENPSQNQVGCANDRYGCNTTTKTRGVLGDGDVQPFGLSPSQVGESCPRDAEVASNCAHGTEVSSIIVGDYESDFFGVCPVCQVMSIKVVAQTEKGIGIPDSAIIAGLTYISRWQDQGSLGVRVVNASFGKFVRSKAVALLVRQLAAQGVLVVGAAGNEDTMTMQFPAAFSEAVAVASSDMKRDVYQKKASHSNFGRWVDISAPGTQIRVAMPGEQSKDSAQGTSHATPHVAGVAGLLLAVDPSLSYSDLRARVVQSADSGIYSKQYNHDNYYPTISGENVRVPLLGAGHLNANDAVLNNIKGFATFNSLDRVTSQCGLVGLNHAPAGLLGLLLLIPFFLTILVRLKEK